MGNGTPLVLNEASALAWGETETFGALSEGASGVTVYDPGFPIPPAFFHATDESYLSAVGPDSFVHWDELNYEIGGETGAVDRNAYVVGGITNYSDVHDFRGDHVMLTPRDAGGAYGAAGWDTDDYSNAYALGVAAQGYPDVSREESWDSLSAGF